MGIKHCSVFVWHWEVDECGNKYKKIDKQFSLSYGNSTFHETDSGTFDADTKAFLEGIGNHDIPLPFPYTQEGFDQRVIAEGESYSQGRYNPIDGPNSNTAARNVIVNSGGDAPIVPGAVAQSYTPNLPSPPKPNYWYGR